MADSRISPETRARITQAWPDILEELAAGALVSAALDKHKISVEMKRAYLLSTPGAREAWDDAKRDSADTFFDKVLAIANDPGPDPHSARVSADLYRWLAGKRNPRDYSDKSTIDVNVRTLDLTAIINAANARLANSLPGRLIEGVASRVTLSELL